MIFLFVHNAIEIWQNIRHGEMSIDENNGSENNNKSFENVGSKQKNNKWWPCLFSLFCVYLH
jgi:hypothetical protein